MVFDVAVTKSVVVSRFHLRIPLQRKCISELGDAVARISMDSASLNQLWPLTPRWPCRGDQRFQPARSGVFDVKFVSHFALPLSLLAARFGDPEAARAIPLATGPIVKPIGVRCGNQGSGGTTSAGYNQYG
jgi:hypothetical protein